LTEKDAVFFDLFHLLRNVIEQDFTAIAYR